MIHDNVKKISHFFKAHTQSGFEFVKIAPKRTATPKKMDSVYYREPATSRPRFSFNIKNKISQRNKIIDGCSSKNNNIIAIDHTKCHFV